MEIKKPYVDTYLIPGREVNGVWQLDWFVARYVDADGMWRCTHKHITRDEAQRCGEEYASGPETWNADSKANMHIILLLRALAAECGKWKRGLPEELIEDCDAAIRSDWKYLQGRYPNPEAIIEAFE